MVLGLAVFRKPRLARSERGDEHEAFDPGRLRGNDQRFGAGDVAEVEAHRIGRVDHSGDVQDGLGAFDEPGQRGDIGELAADPLDALAWRLLAPRQHAQRQAPAARFVDHRLPDEAGAAGDRQRHSRTSWSRWITAERGA
jgi:hypothetical protein